MNTERLRELAGMSKAVGGRKAFLLNESDEKIEPVMEMDAKSFIRSLDLYQDLLKDKRAKPAVVKAAGDFVREMGNGPLSPKAQKYIHDKLANIAADSNPQGIMMSRDEEDDMTDDEGNVVASDAAAREFEAKSAAQIRRKERAERTPQPKSVVSDATLWLRKNPNATAKEFVEVAVNAGMNPRTARARFYKEKKKMAARAAVTGAAVECYILQKGEQVLSERSRPLIPHFIEQDDYNSEYFVFETKERAEAARDNFILHVSEKMEIVELDDVKKSLNELNQAGTLDSDQEVKDIESHSMNPKEARAYKVRNHFNKIKHQYRNPARAQKAAEHAVDNGKS